MESDRAARLEAMFVAHHRRLAGYVVRRAPDWATADDVLSETWIVAWRRLESVPQDALPWLLRVAANILANTRRSGRRSAALLDRAASAPPPAAPALDAGLIAGDDRRRIATALRGLTDAERQMFLLVELDELSPAQAAKVAGCSAVAGRARLLRARRRLRGALRNPGNDAATVQEV